MFFRRSRRVGLSFGGLDAGRSRPRSLASLGASPIPGLANEPQKGHPPEMKKKIETPLELGHIKVRPAKVKDGTDGKLVRTGPHVLELPLSHTGRADVLADYLGSVGSEVVAVKIKPGAGGIDPWEGLATIGSRSIKPARGGEPGVISVSFTLSISAENPELEFLPLIRLRLAMAKEDIVAAGCYFAPTQEELNFGG